MAAPLLCATAKAWHGHESARLNIQASLGFGSMAQQAGSLVDADPQALTQAASVHLGCTCVHACRAAQLWAAAQAAGGAPAPEPADGDAAGGTDADEAPTVRCEQAVHMRWMDGWMGCEAEAA